MTDPAVATLSLLATALIVLVLCFGGTLVAAGLWHVGRAPRERRRTRSTTPATSTVGGSHAQAH